MMCMARLRREVAPINARLLTSPDYSLVLSVLLRVVRRDELLLESVALNQVRVVTAG